jgi:hypothetical protein
LTPAGTVLIILARKVLQVAAKTEGSARLKWKKIIKYLWTENCGGEGKYKAMVKQRMHTSAK